MFTSDICPDCQNDRTKAKPSVPEVAVVDKGMPNSPRPKRSILGAFLCYALIPIVFITGIFLIGSIQWLFGLQPGGGTLLTIFSFSVLPVCFYLIYTARRLSAPTADWALGRDTRRPVLLLRPFSADGERLAFGSYKTVKTANTEESELVKELASLGPVLAIGRPDEELRHIGAARIYVPHGEWKSVILHLFGWARCVVIRCSSQTPGLLWELEVARKNLSPEALVLQLPSAAEEFDSAYDSESSDYESSYRAFASTARLSMGIEMPSALKGFRFVAFDDSWRPKPVKEDDQEPFDFTRKISWKEFGGLSAAKAARILSDHLKRTTTEQRAPPELLEFLRPFA